MLILAITMSSEAYLALQICYADGTLIEATQPSIGQIILRRMHFAALFLARGLIINLHLPCGCERLFPAHVWCRNSLCQLDYPSPFQSQTGKPADKKNMSHYAHMQMRGILSSRGAHSSLLAEGEPLILVRSWHMIFVFHTPGFGPENVLL